MDAFTMWWATFDPEDLHPGAMHLAAEAGWKAALVAAAHSLDSEADLVRGRITWYHPEHELKRLATAIRELAGAAPTSFPNENPK